MRLGLHVMADRMIDEAIEYCGAVKPATMKWMQPDPAVIAECIRRSPGTRHVLRQYWGDQRAETYSSFQNAALDRVRHTINWLRVAGIPTEDAAGPRVWMEGFNEHVTKDTPRREVEQFAGDEVRLAVALNAMGAGALLGGCSTGFLDEVHIQSFRAVLDYCQANPAAAAFHFHEYAGPYMQYMVQTPDGRNQWTHPHGPWTGLSARREDYYRPALQGWLTLRYRRLLPLLDRHGWGRVRLAITESGTDDTPPRPGGQGSGWRDWAGSEWARQGGPVGDYADQLHWYLWHITQDARRFLGVVDFGWGTIDPRWNAFDLSQDRDMARRVRDRQLELPAGHAGATEPLPPIPTPTPPQEPTMDILPALRAHLGVRLEDNRAAVLAAGRAYGYTDPRRHKRIVVHHTAAPRDQTWQAIDAFHRATEPNGRGWPGIAYHILIRYGRVHYVGDIATERAHIWGRNPDSIGVCVTGRYDGTTRPALADVEALRAVVAALDGAYGRQLELVGHGAAALPGHGTACPGTMLAAALPSLRDGTGVSALDVAALQVAERAHVLPVNPEAALVRAIAAAGMWPTSPEVTFDHGGVTYHVQRGESPGGRVAAFYCRAGDWANVQRVDRAA